MHDDRTSLDPTCVSLLTMYPDPHPLLAQVPLTVSPFVSLPTSVPLPYSYKTLPSTLPPSILSSTSTANTSTAAPQPPAYVTSNTGQSATPDDILSSCRALQAHLEKLEADAREELRAWEERRQKEDLAEKRRKAPGWLDSGVHILKPENVADNEEMQTGQAGPSEPSGAGGNGGQGVQGALQSQEGDELDRVFGGLNVK